MTTETVEYWRKMILKLKKKEQDLKTRHRIVNHLQIVIISYKKTESEHCKNKRRLQQDGSRCSLLLNLTCKTYESKPTQIHINVKCQISGTAHSP